MENEVNTFLAAASDAPRFLRAMVEFYKKTIRNSAEVRDFAKKFMDKCGPDYARKPIYMEDAFFVPFPTTLREYVYEESRKGFNPRMG